jgi:Co/Zn/Cd efflux system component
MFKVLFGRLSAQRLVIAAVIAFVAMMVALAPTEAVAEERYSEQDAGYVRMASRIIQPIGIVVEAVFIRPFTAIMSWSDPVVAHEYTERHPRICYGQRPHRACSEKR